MRAKRQIAEAKQNELYKLFDGRSVTLAESLEGWELDFCRLTEAEVREIAAMVGRERA